MLAAAVVAYNLFTQDNIQVGIVVGGIAEMYLVSRQEERIFLMQRKGFIKAAIKNGADVVPIFFYGSSLLFDIVGGGVGDSWTKTLSRKLRSSLVMFYGCVCSFVLLYILYTTSVSV
jgi:Diacylglycerol acyltransferase